MRTFIALPLPAEARALLGDLQSKLRSFGADVKWTAADAIHLTLKFLGEISPASLPELSLIFGARPRGSALSPCAFKASGAFPICAVRASSGAD